MNKKKKKIIFRQEQLLSNRLDVGQGWVSVAAPHACALLLLQCKHILAVYLCGAMGVTQQESVSDGQMTSVLSGADAS